MEEKVNWRKNTFLLALSLVGTSASYTMLIPFLPLYLLELGVANADVSLWSGAVFSVTFFIAAVMAPIWGKFADIYGKKKMAVRSAIGLTLTYFLGGLVLSPWHLFGVRVVQGFANGFMPAALSITSAIAPKKQMGYALGIVQTGQIIGNVLGPLIGGVIASIVGMRMSFFVAAAMLLLVTVLVMFGVDNPDKVSSDAAVVETTPKTSLLDDFRLAASNKLIILMLTLGLMVCATNMVLEPVISLYVAELQQSMDNVALHAGVIFSLGGIAGIITTAAWGKFGQKHGYFKAMAIAFMGAGLCVFLQYFPSSLWGFAILQFIFGLFFVGANPAISATLVNETPTNFRGRIFGIANTANQTGSMLGPLIGGAISSWWGIKAVFLTMGPIVATIGAVLWYKFVRQKAKICN